MGGAEGGVGAGVPKADVSVCGGVAEARRKRRQIGNRKVGVTRKLDESKAAWIVRQKAGGGMTSRQIAEAMGARTRRVQARGPGTSTSALPTSSSLCPWTGRPAACRGGASTARRRAGAARIEGHIERSTGMHIPHGPYTASWSPTARRKWRGP